MDLRQEIYLLVDSQTKTSLAQQVSVLVVVPVPLQLFLQNTGSSQPVERTEPQHEHFRLGGRISSQA